MLPNPELTVETADNFNLSFSIDITPAFNFQFSPFYNYIQDRITYVRGSQNTGKYENFGQVSYKGFDITADCKLLKKVSLKTAYTYLEAKDKLTTATT